MDKLVAEMTNSFQLASDSNSHVYEDGERVYPCRCGETHRGQYAAEEWRHHNCFHSEHIIILGPTEKANEFQGCCITCGAVFIVVWERPPAIGTA